jgi:glycosyltransferase involved in cell wall biosynthesis
MASDAYTFTVFTATFNRAHTLQRVYDSLEKQTFRDFEWLIVDDGSNDGTDALVEAWQRRADFPVRYKWQPNRGKHIAFNHGVREARGKLFLQMDSDDACVPSALERFLYHWEAIPPDQKPVFSAVTALCKDQNGRLVGKKFPCDVTDSDSLEIFYRFGVTGEKWGFHRTDVLREYPFPEGVPTGCVPEGIVWSQIARKYKTRYVNEVLRVYYTDQPSLTRAGAPGRDAAGGQMAQLMKLNHELDYFKCAPLEFCRAAARYVRFSFHYGMGIQEQVGQITNALGKVLWVLGLPVGIAVYLRDRKRFG